MPRITRIAFSSWTAAERLRVAETLVSHLMSDRPAKRYRQTREFVELLDSLNGGSVTLERGLTVYVYANSANDVARRPAKTARKFYLPKGATLAREVIVGTRYATARTIGGGCLIMAISAKKERSVKLIRATGFVPPTGRVVGTRYARRGGSAMHESA